jgi:hypothetical protein
MHLGPRGRLALAAKHFTRDLEKRSPPTSLRRLGLGSNAERNRGRSVGLVESAKNDTSGRREGAEKILNAVRQSRYEPIRDAEPTTCGTRRWLDARTKPEEPSGSPAGIRIPGGPSRRGIPSRATGSRAPHPKPGFPLAARRPGSYLFIELVLNFSSIASLFLASALSPRALLWRGVSGRLV